MMSYRSSNTDSRKTMGRTALVPVSLVLPVSRMREKTIMGEGNARFDGNLRRVHGFQGKEKGKRAKIGFKRTFHHLLSP
jgi:hypothetical protein